MLQDLTEDQLLHISMYHIEQIKHNFWWDFSLYCYDSTDYLATVVTVLL